MAMNYQTIKKWCKEEKDKIVIGMCFVLIFIVGFGSGKYVQNGVSSAQSQNNYTTNSNKKPFFQPNTATGGETAAKPAVSPPQVLGATTTLPCIIKGNISSNKKIYHVKGGAFYDRTKAEMCFNTEDEAQGAGFVKSSR
jgi:hypothetical protein